MNTRRCLVNLSGIALLFVCSFGCTLAATHYVDATNPTPLWPYTDWATAAAQIQDAIDAAASGEEILVTNGTYCVGGRPVRDVMCRVALPIPVTVKSVNGPAETIIEGVPVIGDAAVRCAYLGEGAVLAGFTLTNGATRDFIWWPGSNYGRVWGGGVWCESATAVVSNCVIAGNSSKYYGGGAHGGVLIDCVVIGNSTSYGGGAASNTLVNCIITGTPFVTAGRQIFVTGAAPYPGGRILYQCVAVATVP